MVAKNRLTSTGIIANHLWLYGAAHRQGLPKEAPAPCYRLNKVEVANWAPEPKVQSEYVVHHAKPTYRIVPDPKGQNILRAVRLTALAAKQQNKA